jgi:CRISPR/Cas system-associated protein Cas7 (RAMP superfamily)
VVVLRREPEVMLEMVRLVVEAVPKKPVPETVSAVEEAYGNCDAATVEDAKKTPPVD